MSGAGESTQSHVKGPLAMNSGTRIGLATATLLAGLCVSGAAWAGCNPACVLPDTCRFGGTNKDDYYCGSPTGKVTGKVTPGGKVPAGGAGAAGPAGAAGAAPATPTAAPK